MIQRTQISNLKHPTNFPTTQNEANKNEKNRLKFQLKKLLNSKSLNFTEVLNGTFWNFKK